MAEKHVIKISAIISFFKDDEKLIARGEIALESGHLNSNTFDADLSILRGSVHASMRDRQYSVEVSFNSNWNIVETTCTCPRGQLRCHHMAAVMLFGHYNVSVTDKACSWNLKNNSKSTVQNISELYPLKPHTSTPRNLTEDEINLFKTKLKLFNGTVGFSWLLAEEGENKRTKLVIDVETILFNNNYLQSNDKRSFMQHQLQVTDDLILKVVEATVGQI
ncbi:hypothetical protein RN001_005588 [Aquatica leii]|uniref:SWIM-type domain-containing protein n=1 Tax=Aquatica leii TaxID=1421715 RepID=A0AAN7SIY8_9COLE|nr:hypothetical protein RN001_005588 [Aquatica leii]